MVAALAVVVLVAATGPSGPELSLSGGGGPLSMMNSENGAVLTVAGMAPGDTEVGTVTVGNTGSVPGDFTVSSTDLEDLPGTGGGRLSDRLQLSIAAAHPAPAVDETLFSGPLSAMERIELGWLAPGDARTFRFSVTFPDGGTPSSPMTGDNVYQGAQTSVGYRWDAVAATSPAEGSRPEEGADRGRDRDRDRPGRGSRRPGAPAAPALAPPETSPMPVGLKASHRQRFTTRGVRVALSCHGECVPMRVSGSVRLPGGAGALRARSLTVVPRSPAAVSVRLRFTRRAEQTLRRRLAHGARPVVVVRAVRLSPSAQGRPATQRIVLLP